MKKNISVEKQILLNIVKYVSKVNIVDVIYAYKFTYILVDV